MTQYVPLLPDVPQEYTTTDSFNRESLAKLVANSINELTTQGHECMCFGIYGKWGEGKTTFLNYVKKMLLPNGDRLTVVDFKPWIVGSEEELLKEFFNTINKDILESIKGFLKKYGNAISLGSKYIFNLLPIRYLNLEEGLPKVEGLGDKIKGFFDEAKDVIENFDVPLLEQKNEISKLFKDHKIHLVVFIDDIDRLDKDEVHALFRLIRQVADFLNTIYVLAMDPVIVAKSLKDYVGGSISDGYDFIDKIVQVPIALPKITEDALSTELYKKLDQYIASAPEEKDEIEGTIKVVSDILKTPRQIIRFTNQIGFLMPSLKGEVCLCDLFLLEAIKILNPLAHSRIYENKSALLCDTNYVLAHIDKDKEEKAVEERYNKAITDITELIPLEAKQKATQILHGLFNKSNRPQILDINERRVKSSLHFSTYFVQSLPNGFISNKEITELEHKIDSISEDELTSWIDGGINKYDLDNIKRAILLVLYRTKNSDLRPLRVKKICLAISKSVMVKTDAPIYSLEYIVVPAFILQLLNESILTRDSNGELDYHCQTVKEILCSILRNTPFDFGLEIIRLLPKWYSSYYSLAPDYISPLIERFEAMVYVEQLNFTNSSLVELFNAWYRFDQQGPKNYLTKAIASSDFNSEQFLSIYNDGTLSQENNQRMTDMVLVFGEVVGDLLKLLSTKELDEKRQKEFNVLSSNWKTILDNSKL